MFYRERAAGFYAVAPYTLSQSLAELPYLTTQVVFYTVLVYFMIGFQATAQKFFEFLLIEWLVLNLFTYMGMFLVYITPILPLALLVGGFIYSTYNLFSGFLIARPAIPDYWIWIYYANPVSYGIAAIVESNVAGSDNVVRIPTGDGGEITVKVDDYLKEEFGLEARFLWRDVAILAGFALFFRVGAMFALRYFNFQSR